MGNDTMDIELIEDGIGILKKRVRKEVGEIWKTNFAQASGEDDDLVNLAHLLQKVVDTRAF